MQPPIQKRAQRKRKRHGCRRKCTLKAVNLRGRRSTGHLRRSAVQINPDREHGKAMAPQRGAKTIAEVCWWLSTSSAAQAYKPLRFEGKPSAARCLGEHLECSPCGMKGGCACVSRWPGPEVLLSLLPTSTINYTGSANFKRRDWPIFPGLCAVPPARGSAAAPPDLAPPGQWPGLAVA